MLTTVGIKLAPLRRAKSFVVAAMLMLSLGLGVAPTAQHAGAMAPDDGAMVQLVRVCYKDPGLGLVCTWAIRP